MGDIALQLTGWEILMAITGFLGLAYEGLRKVDSKEPVRRIGR